jgi:type 1 fimbria pilin
MSRLCFLTVMLMTSYVSSVPAVQTGDSTTYAFKGHLIQANVPCTVNNGQVINVPFGNVSISKVGNGEYLQTISYTLDCGSATNSNTVSLMLQATPTDWDPQAMVASVQGLGVRILDGGTPVDLNKDIDIELDNPPELQAQLITKADVQLTEQAFTAGGTLIAEYQ